MQEIKVGYRRENVFFFFLEEQYRKRAAEKRGDISVMDRKQRGTASHKLTSMLPGRKPSGKLVMKSDIILHHLNRLTHRDYVNI